jgi:tRNA U34 5-carboxymethylaminomethyl modifying GTPase MnmE/TrmE
LHAEECARQADAGEAVLLGNAARALATKLGDSVGAVYSEDLLESLFSRFCVGK